MKKHRTPVGLVLLLLAAASSAATLTQNGQRIEETLLLSADIDLGQSIVRSKSASLLNEQNLQVYPGSSSSSSDLLAANKPASLGLLVIT